MRVISALCPSRHPDLPKIKTVAEQGVDSPLIWQTILASKNMDTKRKQELTEIFTSAERTIGQQEIFKLTDQTPPLFYGVSSEQHFRNNWKKLNNSRDRWRNAIREN
jgi:tripartite-type tricarboxylate transporter receptor subunit TctC